MNCYQPFDSLIKDNPSLNIMTIFHAVIKVEKEGRQNLESDMAGQSIIPIYGHWPIAKQVGNVWLGVADSQERHVRTKYKTVV